MSAADLPERRVDGAAMACSHCGLPVPRGLRDPAATEQFCCAGCRTVWALLRAEGLEAFYRLAAGSPRGPAQVSGRQFAELDDPAFSARYVRPLTQRGLLAAELYLEGVHCTACLWLVERLPRLEPGVIEARLELGRSVVRVVWDPARTALSRVARALDRLGYTPHPYRAAAAERLRRRDDRAMLVRIAVAGAVAGNVMLLAAALYAGLPAGMEPGYQALFRWASLLLTVPAVAWCAAPFFRSALGGLRARALHIDLPVALGLVVGFAWGAANTLRGRGPIYFDSLTVLIFLLLVGRWLHRRQYRRAADAAELLFALTPRSARLVEGERLREVPIEAVLPGMVVELRAGEAVPVDGRIRVGTSSLDTALLSGEARPIAVAPGALVHAGTLNLDARLLIEVIAAGEQTRVAQLMRQVEAQARRRAPIVEAADRVAGYFVAAALVLALITLAYWWRVDARSAIDHALALLVVTCPCALGLATPLAVSAAIGRAARRGMLIKGGDALERLARPGLLLLDKTGTVTTGRMALVRWVGDEALRGPVAALEAQSAHVLARALAKADQPLPAAAAFASTPVAVDAAPLAVAAASQVSDVRETRGAGIEGRVDGAVLVVGAARFVAGRCGAALPAWASAAAQEAGQQGLTPVWVAREGRVVAVAALGDALRPEARAVVDAARRAGWRVELLSGDDARAVVAIGRALGLADTACHGAASPEEKLAHVQRERASGQPVVMVGDGVNDAAALVAATAGVAVQGGAEASLEAADAYLGRPGLAALGELLAGARATLRVIRLNLALSLGYNAVAAALAMSGRISPLLAAVLMPLSSLTVVIVSYRARTFGEAHAR
ncbi:MAG: heavy metal translocating P-type ATPase [Proteobacteria bacterium]|nr:heavy metal translocating P-type ATPase [Pseudomonadota bacterium]